MKTFKKILAVVLVILTLSGCASSAKHMTDSSENETTANTDILIHQGISIDDETALATESTTESHDVSEPVTETTEPVTESTTESTEPTQPSEPTQPTEPKPTEPTQPSTPPTEPTEPKPTEPKPTQPTPLVLPAELKPILVPVVRATRKRFLLLVTVGVAGRRR